MDLPHSEHVEVAVGERKALIFYTGQPKAERQDREGEGEEPGDDEEQSPQSKTAQRRERKRERRQNRSGRARQITPRIQNRTESIPLLLVLVAEVEEA